MYPALLRTAYRITAHPISDLRRTNSHFVPSHSIREVRAIAFSIQYTIDGKRKQFREENIDKKSVGILIYDSDRDSECCDEDEAKNGGTEAVSVNEILPNESYDVQTREV